MWRSTRILVALIVVVGAIAAVNHFSPGRPTGSVSSGAPELVSPTGFINTAPFKLADLIGKKVILVDFWTYSCINCLRTIPYLNAWYSTYHDKGLEIVGVHTPEFDFEKDTNNVQAAVTKLGIKYPVVLDSNYGTWNAFGNQYWPHEYLIGLDGTIVHDHVGEGDYDVTEQAIQTALSLTVPMSSPSNLIPTDFSKIGTPELYLGTARNDGVIGKQVFLSGKWNITSQYATNTTSLAHVKLTYTARQVNIVAGADKPVILTILKDGAPAGSVTVSGQMLYTLIDDPAYGTHTIEFIIDNPGLQLFTFTFS